MVNVELYHYRSYVEDAHERTQLLIALQSKHCGNRQVPTSLMDIHGIQCAVACEGTCKGGDQGHLFIEHTVQQVVMSGGDVCRPRELLLFAFAEVCAMSLQAIQSVGTAIATLAPVANSHASYALRFQVDEGPRLPCQQQPVSPRVDLAYLNTLPSLGK